MKKELGLDEEVPTEYIEKILKGKTQTKTLVILDGYDEFTKGNKDLDKLIKSPVNNCFLLLTSRFGEYLSNRVRSQMHGEMVIKGFSEKNIEKCSSLYLGSPQKSSDFLRQAEQSQIYELLHVPIVLLMSCLVFTEKGSLPKTQTELFSIAREIIMDRTTLKKFGKPSSELEGLESWLDVLGEMSWEALQSNERQLLLDKVKSLKTLKLKRSLSPNQMNTLVVPHNMLSPPIPPDAIFFGEIGQVIDWCPFGVCGPPA